MGRLDFNYALWKDPKSCQSAVEVCSLCCFCPPQPPSDITTPLLMNTADQEHLVPTSSGPYLNPIRV